MRRGVFADAVVRAAHGAGGVGEGGFLFERGGVYGGRGGAALCVCMDPPLLLYYYLVVFGRGGRC